MDFLNRLFGRKPTQPTDDGIYFYVRCVHCQRVLRTRLNPANDLSLSDEGGYEVRKEMTDDRCFRRLTLTARFDERRAPTEVNVEHGVLIDRETWLAEKDLPRWSAPERPGEES